MKDEAEFKKEKDALAKTIKWILEDGKKVY